MYIYICLYVFIHNFKFLALKLHYLLLTPTFAPKKLAAHKKVTF